MRRNWIFLALLLSVGVNCGLLGMGIARHRMLAERAREHSDRPPGRDGARLADRLELTGSARESFLRLQRELAERVHAGRRRIDDARRDLRLELISPEPDRARVEALLAGVLREQEALDRALVANVFAAREVLDGPAEREYLRFVERFGSAVAGPRPPGPPLPPGEGLRPRFGARRERGRDRGDPRDGPPPGEPEGPANPEGPDDRP
ncbi:MAG: periplasmic heavy metal sensor [Thermoanaerobaculia bacterium]